MSVEEIISTVRRLPDEQRKRFYTELDEVRSNDPAAPKPKQPSAYDRAKHLIGPGSGIHDLATNPKYMEGFGEDSRS